MHTLDEISNVFKDKTVIYSKLEKIMTYYSTFVQ